MLGIKSHDSKPISTLSYSSLHFVWVVDAAKHSGHAHLCVCVCVCVCRSVHCRIPTLLQGSRCNLGNGRGVPHSCALLGGFTIGVWVLLLWHHSPNAKCQRVLALDLCLVKFSCNCTYNISCVTCWIEIRTRLSKYSWIKSTSFVNILLGM